MKNSVYSQFLSANSLKQVDLARFLGVSESAISNCVKGKSNLSPQNLIKILQNTEGWDTTMFAGIHMTAGDNSVVVNENSGNIDNRHFYSDSPDVLRAQIDLMDRWIKEKDAQIKEKDAQIKELLSLLHK